MRKVGEYNELKMLTYFSIIMCHLAFMDIAPLIGFTQLNKSSVFPCISKVIKLKFEVVNFCKLKDTCKQN